MTLLAAVIITLMSQNGLDCSRGISFANAPVAAVETTDSTQYVCTAYANDKEIRLEACLPQVYKQPMMDYDSYRLKDGRELLIPLHATRCSEESI